MVIISNELVEAYKNKKISMLNIAKQLHCSENSVRSYLHSLNIVTSDRSHYEKKERNQEIRVLYGGGCSLIYLAKKYQVSRQRIFQIIKNKGRKLS